MEVVFRKQGGQMKLLIIRLPESIIQNKALRKVLPKLRGLQVALLSSTRFQLLEGSLKLEWQANFTATVFLIRFGS